MAAWHWPVRGYPHRAPALVSTEDGRRDVSATSPCQETQNWMLVLSSHLHASAVSRLLALARWFLPAHQIFVPPGNEITRVGGEISQVMGNLNKIWTPLIANLCYYEIHYAAAQTKINVLPTIVSINLSINSTRATSFFFFLFFSVPSIHLMESWTSWTITYHVTISQITALGREYTCKRRIEKVSQ